MTIQKTYNNATIKKILKYTDKNNLEGKPLFELMAEKVSCRKMEIEELIQVASGKQIQLSHEVWLDASLEKVPVNSKIIFDNNESGIVVKSKIVSGLIAPQFQKVFLK